MALKKDIQLLIHQIIHKEWYASYSFLAVAEWFETTPCKGFSKLLQKKAEREKKQAIQFSNYLKQRIGNIDQVSVKNPKKEFTSSLEAFEYIMNQKEDITKCERQLYALASREKDYKTIEFLLKIVQEAIYKKKNTPVNSTDNVTFI